jgi:hypothetical protein
LDTTSGLLATEGHIPLACAASPGDAAPVIGYVQASRARLCVEMETTRLPAGAHLDPAR